MTTRSPFVRIRKRVLKAKKKYESKSVLLPLFDDYICDKTCNRYKLRQPRRLKKLQSNTVLSQENGNTNTLLATFETRLNPMSQVVVCLGRQDRYDLV